jgi:hypothetical protein
MTQCQLFFLGVEPLLGFMTNSVLVDTLMTFSCTFSDEKRFVRHKSRVVSQATCPLSVQDVCSGLSELQFSVNAA